MFPRLAASERNLGHKILVYTHWSTRNDTVAEVNNDTLAVVDLLSGRLRPFTTLDAPVRSLGRALVAHIMPLAGLMTPSGYDTRDIALFIRTWQKKLEVTSWAT